jgi:choline dehydrogenase-like flavoprotein
MTGVVDVVIVGAGAAGAAVAWRLSELPQLRVVCLEQGEFVDPQKYPSTTPFWEHAKTSTHHPSPNVRAGRFDYPIDDSDSPIGIANYNAVGGSTILFSGHFPRFHPSDFRVRSLDGVAEDWPFSYHDLEPYYKINDEMMGISGFSGDPAYPEIEAMMPPVPLGVMGERIAKGFNKLGWHWWPAYSAIVTRNRSGRAACANLGPCNTGCAQGAKSSVDVAYWPVALRNGVELRTRSRVERLVCDKTGRITGVRYFDGDNVSRVQDCRYVILACNGVGTPRLLLNSANEFFPNGVANSSDMVGRNLMLHPCGYVEGVFAENLQSDFGPQGCVLLSQEFYESDISRGFLRGYTIQALRGPGPLEAAVAGTMRGEIPWGRGFYSAFKSRYNFTANMAVIAEDLPDPTNRITLHRSLRDSSGIPAPKVTYRLSDNSRRILAHGLSRGREVLLAAGSVKTSGFGPVRDTGWHLMGTARMGKDPSTSVVDSFGCSHDVRNLSIADSSVFVTSGAVNPTSTLQAVALRVADGVKRNFFEYK